MANNSNKRYAAFAMPLGSTEHYRKGGFRNAIAAASCLNSMEFRQEAFRHFPDATSLTFYAKREGKIEQYVGKSVLVNRKELDMIKVLSDMGL